jgi:predicted kinase
MKSLSLTKPHIIVMVGVPGSGKSFFAEKFSETFHAPYISRDKITALVPDVAIADKLVLLQLAEFVKTKHSIIIEGPTLTRTERSDIAKLARRAGYECMLVWVQTHPDTARMRSVKSAKNGTISSVRTPSEFEQQVKRFNPPNAQEKPVVISGMHTYATQARAVLKKLSSERTEEVAQIRPPARDTQTQTPPPQTPPRRSITIN